MNLLLNKEYKVGAYIRLSKEDENSIESESITNQKNILSNFIKENNYHLVEFYIDDGYTGTNFNRPDFKRLITDINLGLVNTVITKDLSRLGRDYIETCEYVEKWFPQHNVRYISILDNIDTYLDNSNNDITPFKAIINDMYSKDNSKKIKAALKSKQEEGKWVGGCPPFGYKTDPFDKNHLVINEEEAKIVKLIFSLFLKGYSKSKIAKILYDRKIPTPSILRNINKKNKYSSLGFWNTTTIKSILKNDLYKGDMVQNRNSRISYKIRTIKKNKKEDWIIVKNTHEKIISEKDFEETRRLEKLGYKIKTSREEKSLLTKLLLCGECKNRISVQKINSRNSYTICNTYKKYSKLKLCTTHSNNFHKLKEMLIDTIKEVLYKNIDIEETIRKIKETEDRNKILKNSKIKTIDNIIKIKQDNIDKIYIDKIEEKIDDDMYERISNKIKIEIEELNNKKKKLINENINDINIDYIKKLLEEKIFVENILIKLIKKIELHQDKTIDVYFNFSIYH